MDSTKLPPAVAHHLEALAALHPDARKHAERLIHDATLAERARAESAERGLSQTIAQRDYFEDQIARLADRVGCEEEWSNLHAHATCIDDAIDALERRAERAEAERDCLREVLKTIDAQMQSWVEAEAGSGEEMASASRASALAARALLEETKP